MSRLVKFVITIMIGIVGIIFSSTATFAEVKKEKQVKKDKTTQVVKKKAKVNKKKKKPIVKRRYSKSQTAVKSTPSKYSAQRGVASWYGPGFHGRLTASGQRFNQNALTAAHRTLPFGTKVRVTNAKSGKSVVVTINDRGPFIRGRVLDLSKGAFSSIASTSSGVVNVKYEVLKVGDGKYRLQR